MASDADFENLALPISDDLNKELEQEVLQKRKEIEKLANGITEHKDRLHVMGNHLVNVKQELQLTQVRTDRIIGDKKSVSYMYV